MVRARRAFPNRPCTRPELKGACGGSLTPYHVHSQYIHDLHSLICLFEAQPLRAIERVQCQVHDVGPSLTVIVRGAISAVGSGKAGGGSAHEEKHCGRC